MLARRVRGIAAAWLVGAVAMLAVAVVSADTGERLIVGVEHDSAPYEFIDDDGNAAGFGVELFRAVAEVEGLEYEIRTGTWTELRRDLERGALDVAIGMIRTEAREQHHDFSIPTILVHHAAFVRKESGFEHPRELLDRRVAVTAGTIWDEHLQELSEQHMLRLVSAPTMQAALAELTAGRVDAVIMPELSGLYLLRGLGIDNVRTVGFTIDAEALRFAVPEGRSRLLAQLNEGLVTVRVQGTYDALHDGWHGVLKPQPLSARIRRGLLLLAAAVIALLLAALAWSASLRQTLMARGRQLLATERAHARVKQEKQVLEHQLVKTQRMEALGRMAGAVAHDFNNVLTSILGNASLAREAAPAADVSRFLGHIEQAGQVAADLTRQLLAFSRGQVTKPEVLTWNETIERMESVLQGSIGSRRSLMFELQPDPCPMLLDRAQATQVVLNLTLNARDAVGPNGTIRVGTECQADAGDEFACLIVRDDGAGIDDDVRERIFEPYFTTKEAGRGTGLGLATTYGIVTQNGGTIDVESTPGRGTTFRVRMPRAREAAVAKTTLAAEPDLPPAEPNAVLLVDDDAEVRRVGAEMLTSLGYEPTVVADAEEALRVLRRRPGIAVVITDVVLPGMDGLTLAQRVVEEHPSIRLLITSGFMNLDGRPRASGAIDFVAKPFDRAALETALAKILEADRTRRRA